MVAEVQHVGSHVIEDHRIRVVQVPLVRIEGGHDDLLRLLAPGEVAGRRGGEDLGDVFLVLIRKKPVVIEEITVLVLLLSCARPLRPFMILAGMIHDEVEAYAHAPFMAGIRKIREILHGTQLRLDFPEIRDSVAAVTPVLRALQQRHEMHVVHPGLLKIWDVLLNALQRSRKSAGVEHHAEDLISPVPVRNQFPGFVPLFQSRLPGAVILIKHGDKVIKCLYIIVVDLTVQPFQFIIMLVQTLPEFRCILPGLICHIATLPSFLILYG